jgi:hypothetical protein
MSNLSKNRSKCCVIGSVVRDQSSRVICQSVLFIGKVCANSSDQASNFRWLDDHWSVSPYFSKEEIIIRFATDKRGVV